MVFRSGALQQRPRFAQIESWTEMAIAPLGADNAAPMGDHAVTTLAAQPGRNLVFVITVGLGFAALAAYVTNGFGLLGSRETAAPEQPWLVHSGDKIIVPEGSPLRDVSPLRRRKASPLTPNWCCRVSSKRILRALRAS